MIDDFEGLHQNLTRRVKCVVTVTSQEMQQAPSEVEAWLYEKGAKISDASLKGEWSFDKYVEEKEPPAALKDELQKALLQLEDMLREHGQACCVWRWPPWQTETSSTPCRTLSLWNAWRSSRAGPQDQREARAAGHQLRLAHCT